MISIKSEKEIELMKEGGRILAKIIEEVAEKAEPGITTEYLDKVACDLILKFGAKPSFKGYKGAGGELGKPFPTALCVSVNEELVHCIPSERILKEGDIVSLDLGLKHKNLFTDMAITVSVGEISNSSKKLLETTEKALYVGIDVAREGNRVGDIGFAIESFVRPHRYGIVEVLAGHGVGRAVHEDPYIPNFGKKGTGAVLKKGMVIAIEPMINNGTKNVVLDKDGWTFRTADNKKSAHFEHTILITDGEPEILTKI